MSRILVVDDEKDVCYLLEKFLSKKGYTVESAYSGTGALEKIKTYRPDVVLLDIIMPEMDGIEVLKKIKELNEKITVIMITAVNNDEVGKKCINLGAYDYITKPLSYDYLERVLLVRLSLTK